ncbi:MAG TPA: lysophospholipid acyltransferase family protein [Methylomirabilota bacterium]
MTASRSRAGTLAGAVGPGLLLRPGHAVGVLLDQNATRTEGVSVPFFGVPASTSKGLALLALPTGAPVGPVFLRCEANGHHCMEVGPPVPPPADADVVAYAARFNQVLEAAVRRVPEQWLWMHDRWRTRCREEVG